MYMDHVLGRVASLEPRVNSMIAVEQPLDPFVDRNNNGLGRSETVASVVPKQGS